MHKLLVFDLDGTLAPVGRPMADDTLELLRSLEKAGYRIAVCSGKPTYYLCGLLRQAGLDAPVLIGENGAVLQYGVELPPAIFHVFPCAAEAKEQLKALRKGFDEVCGEQVWYQPNELMLTPFQKNEEAFEQLQRVIDSSDTSALTVYRHCDCFDIVPKGLDKAAGLKLFAENERLSAEDMIAVGDGVNDIPMFEFADVSVKIGRGIDYKADYAFDSIQEAMRHILENRI